MAFYNTLEKSCRAFFNNLKQVFVIIIFDMMFFLGFALAYSKVWQNAMIHVNYILDIMDIEMAGLASVEAEAHLTSLLSQHAEFMEHYRQIGYYVGMLLVSVLLLWIVFHGINWLITSGIMSKKKIEAKPFFGRFALLSLLWWIAFIAVIWLSMKASMHASMSILPLAGRYWANALAFAMMFALFCISYSSYALAAGHRMKSISGALIELWKKKYKSLLPAFAFMAAVFAGEYYLFMKSFMFGGYAAAVFAILILFPTAAWARLYAIEAVNE